MNRESLRKEKHHEEVLLWELKFSFLDGVTISIPKHRQAASLGTKTALSARIPGETPG